MREVKLRGWFVVLIYIGINDPNLNILRVGDRVQLGGHDVPRSDILRRYDRSLANLSKASGHPGGFASQAYAYASLVPVPCGVPTNPSRLMVYLSGKLSPKQWLNYAGRHLLPSPSTLQEHSNKGATVGRTNAPKSKISIYAIIKFRQHS